VRKRRLTAPVKEALFVLGVLTVVAIGAIVGVTVWLTNGGSGGEAAVKPVSPPVTSEQPAPPPPPATSAPSPPPAQTGGAGETGQAGGAGGGNPAAGKKVFETAGCASCHTLADAGASGTVGPNLDEAKPPRELVIERVTNGKAPMPPFKDTLSEQQINDVAAYVVQATSG
jgi:mono/diheme cytochrome c family protein